MINWNEFASNVTPEERLALIRERRDELIMDGVTVPLVTQAPIWTGVGIAARFMELDGATGVTSAMRMIAAGMALLERQAAASGVPKEAVTDMAVSALAAGSAANTMLAAKARAP